MFLKNMTMLCDKRLFQCKICLKQTHRNKKVSIQENNFTYSVFS